MPNTLNILLHLLATKEDRIKFLAIYNENPTAAIAYFTVAADYLKLHYIV